MNSVTAHWLLFSFELLNWHEIVLGMCKVAIKANIRTSLSFATHEAPINIKDTFFLKYRIQSITYWSF